MWFASLQLTIALKNYQRLLAVKLVRSPNRNSDKFRNCRLSFIIFHFATADTQKDSALKIEFLLDTRVFAQ